MKNNPTPTDTYHFTSEARKRFLADLEASEATFLEKEEKEKDIGLLVIATVLIVVMISLLAYTAYFWK